MGWRSAPTAARAMAPRASASASRATPTTTATGRTCSPCKAARHDPIRSSQATAALARQPIIYLFHTPMLLTNDHQRPAQEWHLLVPNTSTRLRIFRRDRIYWLAGVSERN